VCRSFVRTPWPRPRTDEEGRDDTAASSLEYPPSSLACGGDAARAAASLTVSDSDCRAGGASEFDGNDVQREGGRFSAPAAAAASRRFRVNEASDENDTVKAMLARPSSLGFATEHRAHVERMAALVNEHITQCH